VSFRKSNDDLLLRNKNDKIVEKRQILNNICDIIDHKFHFSSLAQIHFVHCFKKESLHYRLLSKLHL